MAQRDRKRHGSGLYGSMLVHGLVICGLLLAARHSRVLLKPLRLPGTPQGQHMLLTYSLGGPAENHTSSVVHREIAPPTHTRAPHASSTPAPVAPAALVSEAGTGNSGDSALGDENVRVALPQVHPRPQPDLSSLPHGTAGDVVVDVVIDDMGKVTATTLVKGLGPTVDKTVMEALRGWTFSPATRNGQNIASEQEILIHYERG